MSRRRLTLHLSSRFTPSLLLVQYVVFSFPCSSSLFQKMYVAIKPFFFFFCLSKPFFNGS